MKKFLLWAAAMVGVLLIICCSASFLMSPEWDVKASVVIDAPAETIHPYVNRPRKWVRLLERYAAVAQPETEMTFGFGGPEEGTGTWFTSAADSSNVRIEYTASDPATGIEYEGMIDSDEVNSAGSITYEAVDGGTRVTWNDHGNLPRGAGLFVSFLESTLEPFFGGILDELKTAVEAGEDIPDAE